MRDVGEKKKTEKIAVIIIDNNNKIPHLQTSRTALPIEGEMSAGQRGSAL